MKSWAAVILLSMCVIQWSVLSPAAVSPRQTTEEALSSPLPLFESTKTQLVDQLADLASASQTPMGIETIYDPDQRTLPQVRLKGATARDILQDIMKHDPRYSWRVTQEVVHIFPDSIVSDPRNYLNIRIPNYRVVNEELRGASAMLRIYIKMFLHPERYVHGFGGGYGYGIPQPPGWDDRNISLDLHGASVREILNTIIIINGNSLWASCIDAGKMMKGEMYYAQRQYSSEGVEPTKDFYWDLIPLRSR